MAIMEKAFENVGLILCDLKHEHRRTLWTALVAEDFRSRKDVGELEVIRDITKKSVPDSIYQMVAPVDSWVMFATGI